MPDLDPKINELEARLESLVRTQIGFQAEISSIRNELNRLRNTARPEPAKWPDGPPFPSPERPPRAPSAGPSSLASGAPPHYVPPPRDAPSFGGTAQQEPQSRVQGYFTEQADSARSNLERFIGENLISKIGILILILGVGIGAKYAIDNNLVSPMTRILLGYGFGFALLGIAGKLKAKYHNFSAVLLSGSLAILYFITYFAYAAYQLIGATTAFPLMVVLTAFAVICALIYNRQIIAHVGLVGAYAVPFLLSSDTGRYAFLFAYISVINAGVLAISVRKYWRPLFYTASIFTWIILAGWLTGRYEHANHFYLALTFLAVFGGIFYVAKLAHGVLYPDRNREERAGAILGTGFIFYSFCLALADARAGLSDYILFFTYLFAAAAVLLITSWKVHGRLLIYLTYPATWGIFGYWFVRHYSADDHFQVAAVFAVAFFALFYAAGLIYKLIFRDLEDPLTVGLLVMNSFIFYGFTIAVAGSRPSTRGFEGLITVGHAAIHGVVSQIVSRIRPDSAIVVQTLTVLVLTFSTIAIPIQFDGNVVTIVWAAEAAALFVVARRRRIPLFEYFSYPLMLTASLSMLADWIMIYEDRVPYPHELNRIPFGNGDFVTALVFIAAAAAIFVVNRDDEAEPLVTVEAIRPIAYASGVAAILVLYNALRIEISNVHHQWLVSATHAVDSSTGVAAAGLQDISHINVLAQIMFTMIFIAALTAVNLRKARSRTIAFAASIAAAGTLFAFGTIGLLLMHDLRVSYMAGTAGTSLNIVVRYAVYLAMAAMFAAGYFNSRDPLITDTAGESNSRLAFEIALTSTLFVTLSAELLNVIAQFSVADGTKFGLSILWGVFALGMIVYGIAFDRTHQRIAAISLLAVTLLKLFFYDISELGTIPKTILFITLGILLLIVSFLYNKYKNLIFAAAGTDPPPNHEL